MYGYFLHSGPAGDGRGSRRPRDQNVAAIAFCGFLDMGDGYYLIFNKNQLMFVVRKSVTAQIKKKVILLFS